MPLGLSTAPKTFSKVAMAICKGLTYAVAYLDDILIHSIDNYTHSNHLREIVQRIQKLGATINFSKSNFFSDKVIYLGRVISESGIQPDTTALKKLLSIQKPSRKKDLERLLGILNWFRPFIKDLSIKLKPITDNLPIKTFSWNATDDIIISKISD